MRLILYALISCIIFCSCSSSKDSVKSNLGSPQNSTIDSLGMYLRHVDHNLYQISLDSFDTMQFESLSEMQLISKNIPFKTEEQQKYLFIQFLNHLQNDIRIGKVYYLSDLENRIGAPTEVTKIHRAKLDSNNQLYRLNSGLDCPDCSQPMHRIFDSCDYLRFKVVEGRITDFTFDIFYSGLW